MKKLFNFHYFRCSSSELMTVTCFVVKIGTICTIISAFKHDMTSLCFSGCGCILELLAEPLYILSQNLALLELRLMVETVATLLRCLTMYFLIVRQPSMVNT